MPKGFRDIRVAGGFAEPGGNDPPCVILRLPAISSFAEQDDQRLWSRPRWRKVNYFWSSGHLVILRRV